ncbi:MAG: type VII toxin-antitoxin system HepT family RNase toxin [Gallionellaceae bacterium]
MLHALQVLIENAIGKAKHTLKAAAEPVPISAYDAFASLARIGVLSAGDLHQWNDVIGIRNRIVHDYMNIEMNVILNLVKNEQYRFIVDFLQSPIKSIQGQ